MSENNKWRWWNSHVFWNVNQVISRVSCGFISPSTDDSGPAHASRSSQKTLCLTPWGTNSPRLCASIFRSQEKWKQRLQIGHVSRWHNKHLLGFKVTQRSPDQLSLRTTCIKEPSENKNNYLCTYLQFWPLFSLPINAVLSTLTVKKVDNFHKFVPNQIERWINVLGGNISNKRARQ